MSARSATPTTTATSHTRLDIPATVAAPESGSRLKVAAARRTVRRLAKAAGVSKRISPHSFRHSYVTAALDAGVPERDIMASTAHSTLAMIQYYDRNRASIERNPTHAVSAFIGLAG